MLVLYLWGFGAVIAAASSSSMSSMMWSVRPLTDAVLEGVAGAWLNVPNTTVTVRLDNEATVLASYEMIVTAARPQTPGSPFLTAGQNNGGGRDVLQVRLVVNGVPYRQSASHVAPSTPYESFIGAVSGHAVVALGRGEHGVSLQWKRPAGGAVTSWSNRPSDADGHNSGRSVVVTARHRYMWHASAVTDARTAAALGVWEDVPEGSLSFVLPEPASLRALYCMSVRPD
ncbi:unnamed protein product, partial [Phaeothamnion confervicola]